MMPLGFSEKNKNAPCYPYHGSIVCCFVVDKQMRAAVENDTGDEEREGVVAATPSWLLARCLPGIYGRLTHLHPPFLPM